MDFSSGLAWGFACTVCRGGGGGGGLNWVYGIFTLYGYAVHFVVEWSID